MSTWSDHCSSVISQSGAKSTMPALQMAMSMWPNCSILSHDSVDLVLVAHVGDGRDAATTLRLHELGGLGEIVLGAERIGHGVEIVAQVEDDDVGAFAGELHGYLAALAARSAADEGDLAVESVHGSRSL
ncbi:MAG: hypothetical protein R2705_10940 [Ilumatobacteraceae bacterium]